MDNKEYVIVEIIPSSISPLTGDILQISALKLKGLNLIDRFDYRVNLDSIENIDLRNMISYDDDKFNHCDNGKDILSKFTDWTSNLDLLIIDNEYTKNYLTNINNNMESIFKYLDMTYSDDVIDKVVDKYNLEYSNYIVDLLYEALIYESNKK